MLQNEPQIFFHLGFPKTGSTYLQRRIFPYIPGIHFFKKHHFRKFRHLKPLPGHKYFFTYEKDIDIKEAMDQIKEKFPDNSYIILVFRPHYSWIVSKYKYYIRKFGYLDFKGYFSTDAPCYLNIGPDIYNSTADYAARLFNNRVLLLNFDELKLSPESFMRKIYDFMGLGKEEEVAVSEKLVKPSFSIKQLKILRRFNDLYRYQKMNSSSKILNFAHHKYRQFVLHTVAFFARFAPADTAGLEKELTDRRPVIEDHFSEDWEKMLKRFA
ncbi:MAG: sulfotransferase [Marinilabilia sp.]